MKTCLSRKQRRYGGLRKLRGGLDTIINDLKEKKVTDKMQHAIVLSESDIRKLVRHTVSDTLTSLGIEHNEPHEMQKDFIHLRDMRKTTESMKQKTQMTLLGIFVTSSVAAFWLGIKEYFGS